MHPANADRLTGFVLSYRLDGYGHAYDHVVFHLEN